MNVHRLIRGKFHLHHSHITGKIFGYAHFFCNSTYIEKSTPEIPFVAHNFFRFDLFYFMKAYMRHLGVQKLWILAVLILHKQIRSIDSLKFYQRSLDELSSTLTAEEKIAVKKFIFKWAFLFFDCLALFEFEKERENFGNYIRRQRNYTIWINCWYRVILYKAWNWLLGKKLSFLVN